MHEHFVIVEFCDFFYTIKSSECIKDYSNVLNQHLIDIH